VLIIGAFHVVFKTLVRQHVFLSAEKAGQGSSAQAHDHRQWLVLQKIFLRADKALATSLFKVFTWSEGSLYWQVAM